MKKSHPQPAPQNPEALYAKVDKSHRRGGPRIPSPEEIQSRNARDSNRRPQSPSNYDTLPPQQQAESIYTPKNPKNQNPEALYAKVDKSHRRGGPRIPSPEEIQSRNAKEANRRPQSPSDYDTPPPQQQAERIYAPQNPLQETAYAPQRPIGNPYDRLGGTPSNGRRATKLASPYEVVNLSTGETEFQRRENPLYDSPSGSTQDLRPPQRPEHLYAELDFSENGGRSPQKTVESVYVTASMGAEGGRDPQKPEHLYAELDFGPNGRSPQKPVESVYATASMGTEGGRDPQKPLEDLYAKVDKSHRRGGPRIPSPEEIKSRNARDPNRSQSPSDYDTPPPQQQAESIYAPQNPLQETAYAPQRPIGNPYDRLGGTPSNGRRATKLASPYEVVNLSTGETEFQRRENPLYDSPSGSAQDLRSPQRPEHLYAEPDFSSNGRDPHKPVESVYAKLGMGAQDGGNSQKMENPLYEGIGSGRTTPPPRTPKDVVTTKLLQDENFQYGVRETQKWCAIVYGNQHALNQQLAKILENPQDADKILWDLAADPESAGKLAGRQMLGIKSSDRKAAEDGFSPLCSALERLIDKTKKLHKQFTREQERDQRHENPERTQEHRHHRHHHRHHARGQSPDSPEHSPQRQRHEENKGMAYAM